MSHGINPFYRVEIEPQQGGDLRLYVQFYIVVYLNMYLYLSPVIVPMQYTVCATSGPVQRKEKDGRKERNEINIYAERESRAGWIGFRIAI